MNRHTSDSYESYTELSDKLITPANLLSLSRFPLGVLTYIALARGENFAAVALFVLAAVTDFLDGFFARRLQRRNHRPNKWGVILDPVADKVFAIIVLVGIIAYRDFPLLLAALIVVRDLGILIAGSRLLKGKNLVVPSNLPGKYYFAALAVLLVSHLALFESGVEIFLPLAGLFWIWSSVSYVIVHKRAYVDGIPPAKSESERTRRLAGVRIALTLAVSALYLYLFFTEQPYTNW